MAQHEELMKKTETMNIVMETDKILREEKERLKQDLQQMQAKVWKLELDILPLKEANAELSEKSGMLQAKKLLEEDIKRWKALNQVKEIQVQRSHLLPRRLLGNSSHHQQLKDGFLKHLSHQDPPHPLPPCLTIHAPPQELGPLAQAEKKLGVLRNELLKS
ncbi:nucleoprotein TPR-like [Castor canadensis]|uniref:Nucleoprotein TPR-like n=1 Tax=Castor canadensis TaxID=51338 RepID=A0AC58KJG0_CASCN